MNQRYEKSQLIKVSIEYAAISKAWNEFSQENGFIDNRQRCNIIIKHSFSVACRKHSSLSLSEIGGIINKDHATVLHATKNHESNIKFILNYERIYKNIEKKILNAIYNSGEISSAAEIFNLKELRERLVETSKALRSKINEVKELKEYNSQINPRLLKENNFFKKHNKEIEERNRNLERELSRVKNLI